MDRTQGITGIAIVLLVPALLVAVTLPAPVKGDSAPVMAPADPRPNLPVSTAVSRQEASGVAFNSVGGEFQLVWYDLRNGGSAEIRQLHRFRWSSRYIDSRQSVSC